jgi:hypothetical protein
MKLNAASLAFTFLAGLTLAGGCAGSDGGSSSGGAGGGGAQTSTNIFITDNLNAGYDAVWVTIHDVSLVHANGNTATVFHSDAGEVVNLRALNDGAARFLFLCENKIPNGAYKTIQVTLDNDLTLYPTGATTGQAAQFDSSLNNNSGMTEIKLNLSPPFVVSANTDDIVVDFDLARWEINGTVVTPAINVDTFPGLGDGGRHDRREYEGTVANLTGTVPNQTFTLNTRSGSFPVQLTSDTVVFRDNGSGSATLANGQRVGVRGSFSTTTNMLLAARVKIKDGDDEDDEPEVRGAVSDANAVSGTFKVTTDEVSGFMPVANFVNVATTTDTKYFSHRGLAMSQADFFAALIQQGSGAMVEVEGGTYESASNTLTARRIKLEDEDDDGHEAEARGKVTAINADQGTFDISLQEWAGFQAQMGQTVGVAVDADTLYKDGNGQAVTRAQFFAMLTTNTVVKVHGVFNADVITADRLEIRN